MTYDPDEKLEEYDAWLESTYVDPMEAMDMYEDADNWTDSHLEMAYEDANGGSVDLDDGMPNGEEL